MKRSNAIIKFASLLEKHLPPIEDVHSFARKANFTAWYVFVEERLKLIDESKRPAELRTLLLCCREEFCNFTRYTRDTGGDALRLPQLEESREHAGTRTGGYLLTSDALMYADKAIARRYAQVTMERASTQLGVERGRYMSSALSLVDSESNLSLGDLLSLLLRKQLGESGFSLGHASADSISFKKLLGPSAVVFICLDDLRGLGNVGWRGKVPLAFFAQVDDRPKDLYQAICLGRTRGLPLRIQGLAPGLQAYTSGLYLFASPTSPADDTIVLTALGAVPTSREDVALVLSHLALAVDCNLAFFRAVENCLAAACAEFAGSA
jgi:hypothetical protein